MTEHTKQGIVHNYAVEILNSSFIPIVRYWFEDELIMNKFYRYNEPLYHAAFIKRVQPYQCK
jgi:hypothetical protein